MSVLGSSMEVPPALGICTFICVSVLTVSHLYIEAFARVRSGVPWGAELAAHFADLFMGQAMAGHGFHESRWSHVVPCIRMAMAQTKTSLAHA